MNLKQKIAQNRERREREKLIQRFSSLLSFSLENKAYTLSQNYFDNLTVSPWLQFENGKLITKDKFQTYQYTDFDDIEQVQDFLNKTGPTLNTPLHVWFGNGPVFTLSSAEVNELIEKFTEIISKQGNAFFYVAEPDLKQGLLIDEYCGYLPSDRKTNDNEVIYEIVYFGNPL